MQKFFFTFMQKQTLLKNTYVYIEAPNEGLARHFMTENFGLKWAFCYTPESFGTMKVEFNLRCLFHVGIDDNYNITDRKII